MMPIATREPHGLPVLYIPVLHGCQLQKLPMNSSCMTFRMRQPLKVRIVHQNKAVYTWVYEQAGPGDGLC